MQISDKVLHAQALVQSLSTDELRLLRGLVAGESQAAIAGQLKLEEAEALAMKRTLMRKLGAKAAADVVRIGIYAGP